MKKCFSIFLFAAMGCLLLVFFTSKPIHDTYILNTIPLNSKYYMSHATLTNPTRRNKSATVTSEVNNLSARSHEIPQLIVIESSTNNKPLIISDVKNQSENIHLFSQETVTESPWQNKSTLAIKVVKNQYAISSKVSQGIVSEPPWHNKQLIVTSEVVKKQSAISRQVTQVAVTDRYDHNDSLIANSNVAKNQFSKSQQVSLLTVTEPSKHNESLSVASDVIKNQSEMFHKSYQATVTELPWKNKSSVTSEFLKLHFAMSHEVSEVVITEPPWHKKSFIVSSKVAGNQTALYHQVSTATIDESSSHNKSFTTANNTDKYRDVMPRPVSEVSVTTSSWYKKSLNVTISEQTPVRGEINIFFIESSCAVRGNKKGVFVNPRQGCAIESVALTNPNATIYYLNTCLGDHEFNKSHLTNDKVSSEVFMYSNVKSFHVELTSYLNNTPLSEWLARNHLKRSRYPVEHSSDILRLVTLWKFGGIYLDLDFIILRTLTDLKQDFAVAEHSRAVGNSVLGFSANGVGHEVADMCLKELRYRFDGLQWGHNGPSLITKVTSELCNSTAVWSMTPDTCKGFTIYPPRTFFPFPFAEWKLMFDETTTDATMALILQNGTYGVHAWNRFSHDEPIWVGSEQPYAQLASRFCPRVYSAAGDKF